MLFTGSLFFFSSSAGSAAGVAPLNEKMLDKVSMIVDRTDTESATITSGSIAISCAESYLLDFLDRLPRPLFDSSKLLLFSALLRLSKTEFVVSSNYECSMFRSISGFRKITAPAFGGSLPPFGSVAEACWGL